MTDHLPNLGREALMLAEMGFQSIDDLFSDGERVRLLHDSVDMRRKSDFSESGCLGHLYL